MIKLYLILPLAHHSSSCLPLLRQCPFCYILLEQHWWRIRLYHCWKDIGSFRIWSKISEFCCWIRSNPWPYPYVKDGAVWGETTLIPLPKKIKRPLQERIKCIMNHSCRTDEDDCTRSETSKVHATGAQRVASICLLPLSPAIIPAAALFYLSFNVDTPYCWLYQSRIGAASTCLDNGIHECASKCHLSSSRLTNCKWELF